MQIVVVFVFREGSDVCVSSGTAVIDSALFC